MFNNPWHLHYWVSFFIYSDPLTKWNHHINIDETDMKSKISKHVFACPHFGDYTGHVAVYVISNVFGCKVCAFKVLEPPQNDYLYI